MHVSRVGMAIRVLAENGGGNVCLGTGVSGGGRQLAGECMWLLASVLADVGAPGCCAGRPWCDCVLGSGRKSWLAGWLVCYSWGVLHHN